MDSLSLYQLDYNFYANIGSKKLIQHGLNFRYDKTSRKFNILALAEVETGKIDEKKFLEKYFFHFRSSYKLYKNFMFESFIQNEKNSFLELQARNLFGGGLRFSFGKTGFGTGLMNEDEKNVNSKYTTTVRSTNYFNFRFEKENFSFFTTGYFQPKLSDFEDYRILIDSEFQFNFLKNWYFSTKFLFLHDTKPALSVKEQNFFMKNGIGFKF
jgi:hypothetical protein